MSRSAQHTAMLAAADRVLADTGAGLDLWIERARHDIGLGQDRTTDAVIGADREDDDHGPEELAIASLTSQVLREAMAQLIPSHRAVLEMRYIQGLSVAETADALGMNQSAQKSLQFRAIRALGQFLPEGFDPNGRAPLPTEWKTRKARTNAKEAQ